MRTLCCIDIVDGHPSDDSLGLLDAALALDPDADALLLGPCPVPGRDLVAETAWLSALRIGLARPHRFVPHEVITLLEERAAAECDRRA